MDWQQIVWIASFPKAGNTYVRLLFDAYLLGQVDINEIVSSVSDDNANRHQLGDGSEIKDTPVQIQNLSRPMAMLRLVNQYVNNRTSDVPLLVKTHSANTLANGIEQLPACLTKATIAIVRDPRKVAPSFAVHMGLDNDKAIEKMQDRYNILSGEESESKVCDVITSWDYHVRSYMTGEYHNVLFLKYEDLCKAPENVFSQILSHAGIQPDMERVKKAVELCRLDHLQREEEEKGFREASPHADRFFNSKKEPLTEAQRIRIEHKFGKLMKKLGYLKKGK